MLLKLNKKGLIILSTYRSGGTQLLQIVEHILNDMGKKFISCKEMSIDSSSITLKEDIYEQLFDVYPGIFKVHLLNHPVGIASLYYSGYFDEIAEEYEILVLERKNKLNCLLSLGVWEEFIASGLFHDREKWTEENMLTFHTNLLSKPIKFGHITLGYNTEIYDDNHNINTFNIKLMKFANQIQLNRCIRDKYELNTLFYEEYENDPTPFIEQHFSHISEAAKKAVIGTYKWKIPYATSDYLEYYDETAKKVLKQWGIDKL